MENEVLQKYLEKLIHLQEQSSEKFTEDNFRIAIDSLGLSEKEKEELDREFDEQFKRGSNYYRSHNYKKAAEFLETALSIEPFHLAAMMLLTDCYKLLYLETQQKEYHDRIHALCKRGLQMQSFNPYFAKIETLTEKCEEARKLRFNRYLFTASLLVLSVIGVVGAYNMQWAESSQLSIIGGILLFLFSLTPLPAVRSYQKLRKQLRQTTLTLKFVPKGK